MDEALSKVSVSPGGSHCLQLFSKICLNIVVEPEELKFRRLKLSNPALAKGLWAVEGSKDLLRNLGFVLEPGGEAFVLPQGIYLEACLVAQVTNMAETLLPPPPSVPAPSSPPPTTSDTSFGMSPEERAARAADIARRKAEAEKEKQRLL